MRRAKVEAPAKRNTRALARRLFPQWSRTMQAKWVLAKVRVEGGTYRFPIGGEYFGPTEVPHFLRRLPPGVRLVPAPTTLAERIDRAAKYVAAFAR